MGKNYWRDFNSPKEISLGDIKKNKIGKIAPIPLQFKDRGIEYSFILHCRHKPKKYNRADNPIPIEWDNLLEELSIAQIKRIVVDKPSKTFFISFQRLDDIEVHIVCKDIIGLP
jgi:histidinol phosphatase-like enzyme